MAIAEFQKFQIQTTKLGVIVANSPDPPPPPPVQNPPTNVIAPSISGTTTAGETLTASPGDWMNSPTSYTYQWIRCDSAGANGVSISGAIAVTYVLGADDVTKTIRVAVTAYNSIGASEVVQSAQTAVIAASAPAVPVNTSLPVVSGTLTRGFALSTSKGSWTNSPTSYAYTWKRCNSSGSSCSTISGATDPSYVLTTSDVGSTIRSSVVATNTAGDSDASDSNATGVVIDAPPPPSASDFPGTSPEGIVMCGDATAGTLTADYAAIRSLGFRVVRKEITSETRVLRAAENDLMFLPLLYGQGDTFHSGTTQKVVDAVNRFARGSGTFWAENPQFPTSIQPIWFEIGNEPYLSHEGMWATVATWAQGWLASAIAAKNAKPHIKLILPVGADINGPQGWRPFTDYVLDAAPQIANVMDAWSCHPYCAGKDPTSYTSTGGGSSDFQRYNYIRSKLIARGVNKPWMITEFGYHTDSLSQGVTESQQASYFGKAYDLVAAQTGGMPKPLLFNFYTVKDFGDGSNQEHNFGFHFRRNGTIKPASAVLKDRAT